jgi:3-hydroxyisobutyrate dehydrogenase
MNDKKIAFIGLGNMGGPMAANLVKAGFEVAGFDLSKLAQMAASKAGISLAESAAEAVKGAGTLMTMLPAGKHVIGVWAEVLAHLAKCALVIDSSTIDMTSARRAHQLASEQGCLSLDAPVMAAHFPWPTQVWRMSKSDLPVKGRGRWTGPAPLL